MSVPVLTGSRVRLRPLIDDDLDGFSVRGSA